MTRPGPLPLPLPLPATTQVLGHDVYVVSAIMGFRITSEHVNFALRREGQVGVRRQGLGDVLSVSHCSWLVLEAAPRRAAFFL